MRFMPRRHGVSLFIFLVVLLDVVGLRTARADEKPQCVAASEKAQKLRIAGRLSEARAELATCGRIECPKLVQQDCSEWMREVLAILPSVVLGAKDQDGRDIVDAKVSIDGKVVTESLDGKAVAVDPGVHLFRFETQGAPAVEEKVVVRQGEKNRILTVTFATGPAEGEAPSGMKHSKQDGSAPIAAFVTGGIGLAALGAALYIDLDANADARNLRKTCAPSCEQSQVDDVENRYVIAGVTAALGGAALIAGVVLFFTHDRAVKSGASRFMPFGRSLSHGGLAGAGFQF
ncbi:MAG: hypothetical protein BGO98_00340 [Myxococcales bacterium 68-20]|nr:MAG: hypothetical protein BGO98_00340 [Myxococcales bacterium 68-20]